MSTTNHQTVKAAKMSKDKKKKPREYEVEKIIFHEVVNDSLVYLIKWKYCRMDKCTWEPEQNLKKCGKILLLYKTNNRLLTEKKNNNNSSN